MADSTHFHPALRWPGVILGIALALGAGYFLLSPASHEAEHPTNISHEHTRLEEQTRQSNTQAESGIEQTFVVNELSLSGTQVDAPRIKQKNGQWIIDQSLRYYFEYFLTLHGEVSLEDIKGLMAKDANARYSKPLAEYLIALFERYIEYRQAIESDILENPEGPQWTLEEIHEQEENLQASYFSQEEIDALFDDSHLAQFADENTTQGAYDRYQKFTEENPNVDKAAIRTELFGVEAAIRLEELDRQRDHWNQRIKDYSCARNAILSANGIDSTDKNRQLSSLIDQHFNATEARRIDVLERNKLIPEFNCQT